MKNFRIKMFLCMAMLGLTLWGCTQDDDGVIPLYSENISYAGEGFFANAELDSGHLIHLSSEPLNLQMGKIWTFSNCALQRIGFRSQVVDSTLVILPSFYYNVRNEDCAAPMYRADTTILLNIDQSLYDKVKRIQVRNDLDSILDSIQVRHGTMSLDSFSIYIDSLFDDVHRLPLRTAGSPSIMKILDSLTARVFYWRPMKSVCEMRVDNCDSVVQDTLFPTSWSLSDTNLVPIRNACADPDLIYCIKDRWKNDSTSLGKVHKRPDTLWHTSFYYAERIPECGTFDTFTFSGIYSGYEVEIVRKLFTPNSKETECGPSPRTNWYAYDLTHGNVMPDSANVDSLYRLWKSAPVVKKK